MPSRKVETFCGRVILKTVGELIDPINGVWDEKIIQSIFDPLEVRNILSTYTGQFKP
jgi:hypothetical protein